MSNTCTPDTHKRGDSFDRVGEMPAFFPDGYFVGWTVASQIRTAEGVKVADMECAWLDDVTTRNLRLTKIDTKAWPLGEAKIDVQFKRTSDGFTFSSGTETLWIVGDVTHDD